MTTIDLKGTHNRYAECANGGIMRSKKIYGNPTSIIDKGKLATIHLAFFLLFPGFFFYHTLLGLGIISAFLGGYFAIISLAIILPLIFFYSIEIKKGRNYFSKTDLYFIIFLAYFCLVIAINFSSGANITIVKTHLLSIIEFINIFIIFKIIDLNDKKLKIVSIIGLLIMSAIIFYFSADGSFFLASLGESKNPESVATYQGFARSYLLTFVVTISFIRFITARILIYCIAAPALFLNGARSELVALLFLIPLIEIYYSKNKLIIALAIFFILAIIGFNFEYILEILPHNRILELANLSQSSSANERHHLTLQAIHTISENPILGDYASYTAGDYSHNILSAWVDLGLFGFIYLLAMLIFPVLRLFFNGFFLRTKSGEFILACSLICTALLLVFTSKTFDDMFIGAALGAYAKYKGKKRYE